MNSAALNPGIASIFVLHNRLNRDIEGALKGLGIKATGLLVLHAISQAKDSKSRTRTRLAEQVGLTLGSVSLLVGRLAAMELVDEDQDRIEKKNVPLHLTKAGERTLKLGISAFNKVSNTWLDSTSRDLHVELFQALDMLNAGHGGRVSVERQKQYLRSVSRHKTRQNARSKPPGET